ncbi:hypothetical protein ALC57_02566, partial [Trachymyrmex cornetzi]
PVAPPPPGNPITYTPVSYSPTSTPTQPLDLTTPPILDPGVLEILNYSPPPFEERFLPSPLPFNQLPTPPPSFDQLPTPLPLSINSQLPLPLSINSQLPLLSIPILNLPIERRGRPGATRYPREMRIRVVEGEIVNSPIAESVSAGTPALSGSGGGADAGDMASNASSVIAVDTEQEESTGGDPLPSISIEDSEEDLSSSFDQVPKKGKKRGRKPKGSNCPGAHALSKLSSKRMDFEDDELDRVDFLKVTKRAGHGLKKRKGLVECNLDDKLTSGQKDAIEEITMLFPQMSPKTVMAETLRVLEIAGEAERKTQSMKGDLRRHIIKALQQTVQELREENRRRNRGRSRAPSSEGEAHGGGPPVMTRGRARGEHTVRDREDELEGTRRERDDRDLPPAYRPPIGGTRKRLEDGPYRSTRVDEAGRIVMETGRSTSGQRGDSYADRKRAGLARDDGEPGLGCALGPESSIPPSDYPASGEAWTEAKSKRARKRARKKVRRDTAPEEARAEKSAGKGPGRVGMPPPQAGGGGAGMRRTGAGSSVPRTSVRGGAPSGPTTAAVSHARAGGAGDAGQRPLARARDNRFRAPRTSAVLVKCVENEGRSGGATYAEVMRLARSKISLEDLGIANTRIRKAQAGGLLIEIPGGEEAGEKAEALVEKFRAALAESEFREEVRIVRPMRRAEIRLTDIDQSVTAEEVAEAVATNGQASKADIRVGPLRPGRGGLYAVWVQCPLSCANKILGEGRLRVDWTSAGVVPLAKRRLQYFRCLAVGHTRASCQSQTDRSTWCFQCGSDDGHKANVCRRPPKCPVCAGRGMPSGHRAGSSECAPFNGRGQTTGKEDARADAVTEGNTGADRGAPAPVEGTCDDNMETCDG